MFLSRYDLGTWLSDHGKCAFLCSRQNGLMYKKYGGRLDESRKLMIKKIIR
jgi:hypothetical protein